MTYALIIANVLAFLFETPRGVRALALTPYLIAHHVQAPPPAPHPEILTMITSMFLHNDWLHLGGNMLFLWIFGPDIEYLTGSIRFLLFYLLCGIVANAVEIAAFGNSHVLAFGASAAIAGVLGAYIIFFGRNRIETLLPIGCFPLFLQLPALVIIGVWFVEQVFYVRYERPDAGGIAYLEHIAGFIAGITLIWLFKVRSAPSRYRYSPE